MSTIEFKNVDKSYDGKTKIIDDFNLKIKDGEFVVLLGESGCGKSTLLRTIAGLETMSSGEILVDEKVINNLEPKDRDIAMVFQNYALYPHMTVYKNIAINLILKKVDKKIIDEKVDEVAKILKIDDLLDRKPRQLSGGQMQRVALARAMIRKPKVFLMDEPLSNLDSKLRVSTRAEIMKLYQNLKTTTIYVTHDQVEAMTMATTIVLMKDGKIIQKGSPDEMYNTPSHIYVAKFIGSPQINVLNAKEFDYMLDSKDIYTSNSDEIYAIRPQHLKAVAGTKFKVDLIENLGSEKYIYISSNKEIDGSNIELIVSVSENDDFKLQSSVDLKINLDKIHKFDKKTGNRK